MKKITLIIFAVSLLNFAHAQFVKNDVGASIFYGNSKAATSTIENIVSTSVFKGLSWYPRYMINKNISIGVPVSLGFSAVVSNVGGSSFEFGFDAPAVVDYNFGHAAAGTNNDDESTGFGGFIGAGFGYTKSSSADDYFGSTSAKSYGPMAHGGVRFSILGGEKTISLRLSYKKGLEKTKYNFFGGSLYYSL
jgi:hypothetical protein